RPRHDERSPAVPAHAVQHAEKRDGGERTGMGGGGDGQTSRSAEERKEHEKAPAADPVGGECGEKRRGRAPKEAGGDDAAYGRGAETLPGEVDADEHARHPGRERSQEGGRVEHLSVTHGGLRRPARLAAA